jgi:RNA polymerase sigma factor (sigma-70 family)
MEAYSRLLLHAARGVSRDHDAAMDAYAYLLEQLRADDFRRLRAYVAEPDSKFTTWLVVVARRLCLDRIRERYGRAADPGAPGHAVRLVRRRLADLLAEELDSEAASAHAAPDSPEMQVRTEELARALTEVLEGLVPADRLLLKLRFDDGLSGREIVHIMGFSTPLQVYRRLNAVLAQLRKSLRQRGFEGPEP